MDRTESLNHSKWECKHHVVFIPKPRRTTLYQELRRYLEEAFHRLARQKESRLRQAFAAGDQLIRQSVRDCNDGIESTIGPTLEPLVRALFPGPVFKSVLLRLF
jgi:hypothetical protein